MKTKTLKQYRNELDKLIKAGYGDVLVVSAGDEEGNAFMPVFFSPTLGIYDMDSDEFMGIDLSDNEKTKEDFALADEIGIKHEHKINAVCIN